MYSLFLFRSSFFFCSLARHARYSNDGNNSHDGIMLASKAHAYLHRRHGLFASCAAVPEQGDVQWRVPDVWETVFGANADPDVY